MVRIVPNDFDYVRCAHINSPATAIKWPPTTEDMPIVSMEVDLKWQLQLDGTLRKIGKCPQCGAIYCTEEVKSNER